MDLFHHFFGHICCILHSAPYSDHCTFPKLPMNVLYNVTVITYHTTEASDIRNQYHQVVATTLLTIFRAMPHCIRNEYKLWLKHFHKELGRCQMSTHSLKAPKKILSLHFPIPPPTHPHWQVTYLHFLTTTSQEPFFSAMDLAYLSKSEWCSSCNFYYGYWMFPTDISLAQPGLPGGAFGASLQGPGKEVEGRAGLMSYQSFWDHVCKYCLTRGTGWLTVWDMWTDISAFVHDS